MPFLHVGLIAVIAALADSLQPRALAYLDPGSGSFILQLILAALLGGAFVVRSYWKRITRFIKGLFSRNTDKKEE